MKKLQLLCTYSLLIIFVLFGCAGNDTSKLETITIGTFSKALGNTPYHIAKYFNWFEVDPNLKNLQINYTEYNDRPTISAALDQGELHVLFSAEAPQYLCRAQGNNIRIVELSTTATQEIIVPTESSIQDVSDLRGKDIAVLAGTSSHYGLLKILKAFNLTPNDVEIRYMGPNEAETAFETGQISAWAVWAPWVEKQQLTNKGRVLRGGDADIHSTMALPEEIILKNQTIARAVVSVIQKAKNWMVTNAVEAQKIAAEELGLDLGVVKIAWPKFNWGAKLNDNVIIDIQEKANFLTEQDKTRLGKPLDVKKEFIDLRFVE